MSIRRRANAIASFRIYAPLNRRRRSSLGVESGACINKGAKSAKLMLKRSLRGSIKNGFKKLRTAFISSKDDDQGEPITQGARKGKEPIRNSISSSDEEMTCFCESPRAAVVEGRSMFCDCAHGRALRQRREREWDEGGEIWARANWQLHSDPQNAAPGFEAKDLPLHPLEGEPGPSNWRGRPRSVSESGVSLYVDDGSVASDEHVTPSTGANSEASGVTCFRCTSVDKPHNQAMITKPRARSAPGNLSSEPKKIVCDDRALFLRRQSLFEAMRMASQEVVGAPCESSKEARMLKGSAFRRFDTAFDDWEIDLAAPDPEEYLRQAAERMVRQLAEFELRPAPTPSSTPVSNPSDDLVSPLTPLSPVSYESFPSIGEDTATEQNAAYDSHRPSHATDTDPLIETAEKLSKMASGAVEDGSGSDVDRKIET